MIDTLGALVAIAFIVWIWLDALTARERAIRFGRALCDEAGIQLLDQTVSLTRLRLKRSNGLPALIRRYGFEVSLSGSDRHRGHLDMDGSRLESWSLPLRDGAALAPPKPPPDHLRLVR